MSGQVFYRKWRPQTLAEVVGQEQVTQTLSNALKTGRVSHAYLFYGPRGTGKTSTGRILAKAVNCTGRGKNKPCNRCQMCQAITEGRSLDVIEIDAASNTGVDDIRSLREKVNYSPNEASYKVYIIDEVHMLSTSASNALLKTLEEPPPYVIFILATTEIHKVPATILSRCQRFDFRRISQADVVSKLEHICSSEGIKIEPEGLRLTARSATGSLRDAENLLEQLTTYYGNEVELRQIQEILGITGDQRAKEIVRHIVNNDTAAGLATINSVNSDGLDLRQFNRELVEYLRELLLVKTGSEEAVDLTTEDINELKELASKTSLAQITRAIKLFGQLELGFDNYSTLPLELALVDSVQPPEKAEKVEEVTPAPPVQPKVQYEPPPPVKEAIPPKPKAVKPAPPVEAEAAPAKPQAVKPTPAAEPEATPAPTNNEIERLKQSWKQLLAEAPPAIKRSNAIAILRSADVKPVSMEGDTVILDSKYEFYKEQIERPENITIAEQIISNFLGRRCRVRCTHKPSDNHLVEEVKKLGAQITSVEEK
jgi:DNA polymerase-3 subunit gamma/tau